MLELTSVSTFGTWSLLGLAWLGVYLPNSAPKLRYLTLANLEVGALANGSKNRRGWAPLQAAVMTVQSTLADYSTCLG